MSDIKHMPLKEFQRLGYLQEANRQFFHPHGLALEITVEHDGSRYLSGVWDYRDDPEGVVFGNLTPEDVERARAVREERMRHFRSRLTLFGSTADPDYPHILEGPDVEPPGWVKPDERPAA